MAREFANTNKEAWGDNEIQSHGQRTYAVSMSMIHALVTFKLAFGQDNTREELGFNLDQFHDLTLAARLSSSPVKKLTTKERRTSLIPAVDPQGTQIANFLLCLGKALALVTEYTDGSHNGAQIVEYIRVKISDGYTLSFLVEILNRVVSRRVTKVRSHALAVARESGTVMMTAKHFWYHRSRLDWKGVKIVEEIIPELKVYKEAFEKRVEEMSRLSQIEDNALTHHRLAGAPSLSMGKVGREKGGFGSPGESTDDRGVPAVFGMGTLKGVFADDGSTPGLLTLLGCPASDSDVARAYAAFLNAAPRVGTKPCCWKCLCKFSPSCPEESTRNSPLHHHRENNRDSLVNRAKSLSAEQLFWSLTWGGIDDVVLAAASDELQGGYKDDVGSRSPGAGQGHDDVRQGSKVESQERLCRLIFPSGPRSLGNRRRPRDEGQRVGPHHPVGHVFSDGRRLRCTRAAENHEEIEGFAGPFNASPPCRWGGGRQG